MKRFVIAGLAVLAASVVGADQAPTTNTAPARVELAYAPPATIVAPARPPKVDELDVANFIRPHKELEVGDLFATPAPAAPPAPAVTAPAAKVEPPPAPVAPPLPFTYLGRMTKSGKVIVYLLRNQEMVLAEAGATLDGTYRVESIIGSAVQFVYLPLAARQDLTIPSAQ